MFNCPKYFLQNEFIDNKRRSNNVFTKIKTLFKAVGKVLMPRRCTQHFENYWT